MFDLDNWQEIWATISRNKLRSFLTGFGVFWGIFMLIILIGIGNGFEGGVLKNVEGFKSNTCFFWAEKTSEAYKGYRKGRVWSIKNKDLELIKKKAPAVDMVVPVLFGGGGDKSVVRDKKSGNYRYKAVYPEQFVMEKMDIMQGRTINSLDLESSRKVCVLGKEVYETLFDKGENAVGQYVKLSGIYFQVVGVVSPTTSFSIGGNPHKTVYTPFSTMQRAFNLGDDIHVLGCISKAGYPASVVEEQVKAVLREAHEISPTDLTAAGSFNIEKQYLAFQGLFMGIGALIWVVGLGALLSGVIGISNIMMVTVRERTREIGVRRAIGAKPRTILLQILSESFVLTSIAGFIGFFIGLLILNGVNSAMSNASPEEMGIFIPPFVSFSTALKALSVLIVSGVLAGVMPALRALQIKAIDAIREE